MEPPDRRISSLSIAQTVPRQTPQTEFGPAFARAAREVVRTGAGLVGGMLPAGVISSAAVSSTLRGAVSAAVPSPLALTASATGGTAATGGMAATSARATSAAGTTSGSPTGQGDAWDMLEAQKLMSAEGQKFNMAYLSLQNEMQKESREHNAISNIMKVRHDSAKAAINNIR
ncbi:hypothetical protein D7Y13_09395 [Corallococcus praedator]|uniref:Uncharacterized protein n=1 Tax=Corallococcus praedator TaxID=2316724 RepID=A0ABX9QLC4_9BACT|nr:MULTISPECIES: hypothetical protein [Corallococcus]RKH17570.1 hypothetical protein D7X74_12085 [Corallococcus sp. CA047B]RKH34255.1 hypothetical protein D7X75_09070 [Corallococcus sp. CA031C]RKI12380.1 hypothetical protein D7Y13_09395 [Corallococcus praedator]